MGKGEGGEVEEREGGGKGFRFESSKIVFGAECMRITRTKILPPISLLLRLSFLSLLNLLRLVVYEIREGRGEKEMIK